MWGRPPRPSAGCRPPRAGNPRFIKYVQYRDFKSVPTANLERNVLVGNRTCWGRFVFRCALIEIVSAACGCPTRPPCKVPPPAAFAAPAEQDQIAGHNFGHILLLAGLLVV